MYGNTYTNVLSTYSCENPLNFCSFFFPLLMFFHCLTETILTTDLSLPLLTSRGNIREIDYRNSFPVLSNQTCVRTLRAIKLKKKECMYGILICYDHSLISELRHIFKGFTYYVLYFVTFFRIVFERGYRVLNVLS